MNEIVAEEQLDEVVGAGLRLASKLLGPAAKGVASVLGKGPTKQAIQQMAQQIAGGGKVTLAQASKLVGKDNAKAALTAAQKQAQVMARAGQFTKNMAAITDTANSVKAWSGRVLRAGLNLLYYKMFWDPLSMYMDNLKTAQTYVDAGKWTPEEFEAYRRREMSTMIGKWAALWATGKLVKLPFGVVSKVIGGTGTRTQALLDTLTPAAQVYFMSWVNDPDNAKTIAEAMSADITAGVIGGIGVAADDKIRSVIPFAKEYGRKNPDAKPGDLQPGDAKPAGEEPADVDATSTEKPKTDATATPATPKPGASATPEKLDPAEWKQGLIPGYVKNIKTGEVKVDPSLLGPGK